MPDSVVELLVRQALQHTPGGSNPSAATLARLALERVAAEPRREPMGRRAASEKLAAIQRAVREVVREAGARGSAAAAAVRPAAATSSPSIIVHAAAIATPERQALIALYNSTNGDSWNFKTGWKQPPLDLDGFAMPGTECTWYGVACDGGQTTVTAVALNGNNLSGPLPAALGDLTNLTNFQAAWNNLAGPLPSELGNLTHLAMLYFEASGLTGTIPSSLGNLTNLTDLTLRENQLSGSIPPELGNLTSLTTLTLNQNLLTGSIPPELGNLTALVGLALSSNQLSGAIPAALGNLTNLQSLYLSNNQLSGAIPAALGSLPALLDLDLETNQLSGSIPAALANLTNLQSLYLSGNQLANAIPTALGSLTELTSLDLDDNQLTGGIPAELGALTSLQTLRLADNQLTGSIPAAFSGMTSLTGLDLGGNQLTGPIPPELGSVATLQSLLLDGNQLDGAIPAQLANLADLVWLDVSGNRLTGAIPSELGSLPTLYVLVLDGNQLSGPIPASLANLTLLGLVHMCDFRWNALYSTDAGLTTFLNAAQTGGDWQSTQTVAPTGMGAAPGGLNTTALVSWTPIAYTGDSGGYRVSYSVTSGGPYTFFGITPDKSATSLLVTGLDPGATYYFVASSRTDPHTDNPNTVTSGAGDEVSAATSAALTITPPAGELPYATLGVPYSQVFTAGGGTGPYTWTVLSGSTGELSLSGDGTLSGTVTVEADLAFTVQVHDAVGNAGSAAYILEVGAEAAAVPALGGWGLAMLVLVVAAAGLVLARRTTA